MNVHVLVTHRMPLLQAGLLSILSAHPGINTASVPGGLPDVVLLDMQGFLAAGAGNWLVPVIIVEAPSCGRDVRLASSTARAATSTRLAPSGS